MAYKGNFCFDKHDMMNDGECSCCGETYSMEVSGYDDNFGYYESPFRPSYFEGEPVIAEYDDYYHVPNCSCQEEDLRAKKEEDGYITLDEYGYTLFTQFKKVKELESIDEFVVCRLSEVMKKSFKQISEIPFRDLVVKVSEIKEEVADYEF